MIVADGQQVVDDDKARAFMAAMLEAWMAAPNALSIMSRRALSVARSDATHRVASILTEIARAGV